MSWQIAGDRNGLALGVSDSGSPYCFGQGKQEPSAHTIINSNGDIDQAALARLRAAQCGWRILLPTDSDVHIDPLGEGLYERSQKAPNQPHGMIKFYSRSDTVTFISVLPETIFKHFRNLFESVLLSESILRFAIGIECAGFRVPHAKTTSPTSQEFFDGEPIFFEEISMTISLSNGEHRRVDQA